MQVRTATFAVAALCGAATLQAQTTASQPAPCSTPEHRQFDFWIGEWDVVTPAGQPAGVNRITSILNGCVLLEDWSGAQGLRGQSHNIYDGRTKQWHQTWVDAQGNLLQLDGRLAEDGVMVLEGEQTAPDGDPVLHRVTWTSHSPDELRQHWQMSRDRGATWQTVFDGTYRRR